MGEYLFNIDGVTTKSGEWRDLVGLAEAATKAGHKVILINPREPQFDSNFFYRWNGTVIYTNCKPTDW